MLIPRNPPESVGIRRMSAGLRRGPAGIRRNPPDPIGLDCNWLRWYLFKSVRIRRIRRNPPGLQDNPPGSAGDPPESAGCPPDIRRVRRISAGYPPDCNRDPPESVGIRRIVYGIGHQIKRDPPESAGIRRNQVDADRNPPEIRRISGGYPPEFDGCCSIQRGSAGIRRIR